MIMRTPVLVALVGGFLLTGCSATSHPMPTPREVQGATPSPSIVGTPPPAAVITAAQQAADQLSPAGITIPVQWVETTQGALESFMQANGKPYGPGGNGRVDVIELQGTLVCQLCDHMPPIASAPPATKPTYAADILDRPVNPTPSGSQGGTLLLRAPLDLSSLGEVSTFRL